MLSDVTSTSLTDNYFHCILLIQMMLGGITTIFLEVSQGSQLAFGPLP